MNAIIEFFSALLGEKPHTVVETPREPFAKPKVYTLKDGTVVAMGAGIPEVVKKPTINVPVFTHQAVRQGLEGRELLISPEMLAEQLRQK